MTLNDATRAQNDAASPEISTWLSANAGSGKTRVLTDRVARLLLRGADPQGILCLTYTKAAAGEMQNRLFEGLGRWAMLPEEKLREELIKIGEDPPEDLAIARRLFARAIETPGGLKIRTIHSFCSALLRQFPLEAGVSPGFRELDDTGQNELIEGVLDEIAQTDAAALAPIAGITSSESLVELAQSIVTARGAFNLRTNREAVCRAFDLDPGLTEDSLVTTSISADDLAFLRSVSSILLASGSPTDQKEGGRWAALGSEPSLDVLEYLEGILLFGGGAKAPYGPKIGTIPTKPLQKGPFSAHLAQLNAIMQRVADARPARVALAAVEHTWALHSFAQRFLPEYALAKATSGVLDFDDLIERAGHLLTDRTFDWVMYRLDGRIEHILVDEAQDTSPSQWSVIGALAAEIAAGEGASREQPRSLFVVGDKKQSIYSFQGADAQAFDRMAGHFKERMSSGLVRRELLYSFRSSPAILQAVDCTFDVQGDAPLDTETEHRAFFPDLPGRVDVWPLQPREEAAKPPNWYDPIDRVSDGDPSVQLARHVADRIAELLKEGSIPGENGDMRPIAAGDFLILVQRRSALFDQLIAACKAKGLPMAGADRLKINGALAVKDLAALLAFLALPEDDLSLATALRSPLFGWSEEELFALAANRGKSYLWAQLRKSGEKYPETIAQLEALRRLADFERPYEILETILSKFGGRTKLVARLGPEAEDGIDELLAQALRYEINSVPSLTGFVGQIGADDLEIKRAADTSDGLIQIMTIHGAKGLERPIVILPDTVRGDPRTRGEFVVTESGFPVWSEPKEKAPEIVANAKEASLDVEREERKRLLYVAMTRAKTWLMVAGIESGSKSANVQWHDMVQSGLERAGAVWTDEGDQRILRLETGNWHRTPSEKKEDADKGERRETWSPEPLPLAPTQASMVAPSNLGGAKALAGEGARDEEEALKRGTQIHLLLEHLPRYRKDEWHIVAQSLLGETGDDVPLDALLSEATKTIEAFPDLFTPEALTEVDVVADLPTLSTRLDGTIDRVVVHENIVEIVDYKTNVVVPSVPEDCPDGVLRQMGAYLEATSAIWPENEIRLTVLWTSEAKRMTLPHDLVTSALARAAKP